MTDRNPTFAEALKAFIAKIPTKPATDNEFATVDAACKALKKAGFITRDSCVKERKKYGRKAARARFQFSKR